MLACVQGLAELLPVSSSAHVILAEKAMGLDPTSPDMTLLLVMLHTGTMFAVIVYFWRSWRTTYFASVPSLLRNGAYVAVATAATGVVGLALLQGIRHLVAAGAPSFEIEHLFGNTQLMAASLAAAGIPGALEGAMRYVANPELVSRTHFSRFLVETGVCADNHEVFRRFLKPGKPGYVEHRWAKLGDAVRWITAAGGVAVIAHPARYPFSPTAEYALFSEFVAHGGRGVEVITGAHSVPDQVRVAGLAREFGLLASRGSDFHAPGESRIDLGALPDLPGTLQPVWEALADRSHHA